MLEIFSEFDYGISFSKIEFKQPSGVTKFRTNDIQ